jgi:Ca2+/H+ antiporter
MSALFLVALACVVAVKQLEAAHAEPPHGQPMARRRQAQAGEEAVEEHGSLSIVARVTGSPTCDTELDTRPAVAVYAALILYTFYGLAVVCDEYFCESLEQISAALHLSDDVAGATFMAAGSSAPELFTALVTIFVEPGEQGVGTIVGSAVFNICVIIGLTSLGAGQVLQLWWYPLTRDSAVYAVSILMMVWAMADHQVSVFEASCLVAVYAVYVVLMVFNEKIVEAVRRALRPRPHPTSLPFLPTYLPTFPPALHACILTD